MFFITYAVFLIFRSQITAGEGGGRGDDGGALVVANRVERKHWRILTANLLPMRRGGEGRRNES